MAQEKPLCEMKSFSFFAKMYSNGQQEADIQNI